jgi:septum formation protein
MQNFVEKANKKGSFPFILGSGSPRRRELLGQIMSDYSVEVSDAEEIFSHPKGTLALVMENARIKASSVAQSNLQHWVLGADTLVALEERVLGKPKSIGEATEMLQFLSGQTHQVSTGLCLINRTLDYEETRVETSQVTFKEINDSTIAEYFKKVNPLDKAGGYAIQTRPDLIIKKFEGSHSNVIGLPLELLEGWLREKDII